MKHDSYKTQHSQTIKHRLYSVFISVELLSIKILKQSQIFFYFITNNGESPITAQQWLIFLIFCSKAEMKKIFDIGMEKVRFNEKMSEIRHHLECKNIANLMYMLCMERRKCLMEKNEIETYYKNEIANLVKHVNDKKEKIKELNKLLEESNNEIQLRETCILEVLKQYQKFIYFVLESAPTQAEFLLSIEKMILYELTDNLLKVDVPTSPCDTILKWKNPREEPTQPVSQLKLTDGHNCTNEIHLPSADDMLPAFTYKNKFYIRQEFRDILSKLDQNENSKYIWLDNDENVQMLISIMKESIKPDETIVIDGNGKNR